MALDNLRSGLAFRDQVLRKERRRSRAGDFATTLALGIGASTAIFDGATASCCGRSRCLTPIGRLVRERVGQEARPDFRVVAKLPGLAIAGAFAPGSGALTR